MKSFNSFLFLKCISAGDILSAVNALGLQHSFEIMDLHHLAGSSHAFLALTGKTTSLDLKGLQSYSGPEVLELADPHPDFLDHYLHLKLADTIVGPVTVLESSDYLEFCQSLDYLLKKDMKILDLFWARAGTAQGFIVASSAHVNLEPLAGHKTTKITVMSEISHSLSCFLTGKNPPRPHTS